MCKSGLRSFQCKNNPNWRPLVWEIHVVFVYMKNKYPEVILGFIAILRTRGKLLVAITIPFFVACVHCYALPAQGNQKKITGRVTVDGRAAADVAITAQQTGGKQFRRLAATGDDGRFTINDLPNGVFTLLVSMPGYVSQSASEQAAHYRPGDSVEIAMTRGGVITGSVFDPSGSPMPAITVDAIRLASQGPGKGIRNLDFYRILTDDRGIYRLFGLPGGTYIVKAGLPDGWPDQDIQYQRLVPTYYPSSTLSVATRIEVQTGLESTGIDIRFKDLQGYAISGQAFEPEGHSRGTIYHSATVSLYEQDTGALVASVGGTGSPGAPAAFVIHGVADGNYRLVASRYSTDQPWYRSDPVNVTVKGADVAGISITMFPLAIVSGQVMLLDDPKPLPAGCRKTTETVADALVMLTRESAARSGNELLYLSTNYSGAVNEKGAFSIANIDQGRFHLEVSLPKNLYPKSIEKSQPSSSPPGSARFLTNIEATRGGTETQLSITISPGAATVAGRVVPSKEGKSLPANLCVYLVPGDIKSAKDAAMFEEAVVAADGTFRISNIAPGKYKVIARSAVLDQLGEIVRLTWTARGREGLYTKAETDGQDIELKPCSETKDVNVKLASDAK